MEHQFAKTLLSWHKDEPGREGKLFLK